MSKVNLINLSSRHFLQLHQKRISGKLSWNFITIFCCKCNQTLQNFIVRIDIGEEESQTETPLSQKKSVSPMLSFHILHPYSIKTTSFLLFIYYLHEIDNCSTWVNNVGHRHWNSGIRLKSIYHIPHSMTKDLSFNKRPEKNIIRNIYNWTWESKFLNYNNYPLSMSYGFI